MIKYLFILPLLFFAQLLNAQKINDNITIISQKKSDYQIVIPKNATQIEKDASGVLQSYFYKMTGLSLPIIYEYENRRSLKEIHIGNTAEASGLNKGFAEDDILLTTRKDKLFVTGGARKGVLYAAYTLLTDVFGCEKYTKDLEYIPTKKVLSVAKNINIKQSPSFEYRSTYYEDTLDLKYADWHKINYFFEDRINFVHSFENYVPSTKYFASHPEYFALVDGKRTSVNLCLSNENVFKLIRDGLKSEMAKKPNQLYWSVSANDNAAYCHCDRCNKVRKNGKDFSEILIPFVNRIAREFPSKKISTLAYQASIEAPLYSNIEPNVEIMLCFTHLNRNMLLATGPENAKMFRDFLAVWKSKTKDILAWDYVNNYNSTLSPFPNIPILQPNMQYMHQQGIKKIFINGIGNQKGEFSELKAYLISKLFWNVNADVNALTTQFCNAFYGPAAKDVLAYKNLMEQIIKQKNSVVDVWANPSLNKDDFLSAENINLYKSKLESGLKKVSKNSPYYNRVLKEYASVEYAEIEIASNNPERMQKLGGKRVFVERLNNFQKNINASKVTYLKNGEQLFDAYKQSKLKY